MVIFLQLTGTLIQRQKVPLQIVSWSGKDKTTRPGALFLDSIKVRLTRQDCHVIKTRNWLNMLHNWHKYFFFLIIFILITWYITLIHHNISHNIRYINYTGLRYIKLLVSDKKKRKDKKKHTKIYYNKNWRRLVNKDDIYCIYSGHCASHNLHYVCNFIRHSFL